jgi:outer membrane protein OmpA-like peptidoglycan-associated protein
MNIRNIHSARSPSAVALAVALALGLAACASSPRDSQKLTAARTAVQRAQAQGDNTGAGKADFDAAQSNLQRAEEAQKKGRPASEVDNYAYIAEQSALAAIARHESVMLQKKVETAESERSAILLEARERDAKLAQHKAETAELEAARVQQVAQQRAAELNRTEQQLNVANAQLGAAAAAIEELKAKQTERGIVLTLGDVLFDSGSATLKPGAERSLGNVAEYLKRNDKARLMVEGHTDSVGDDTFNQRLSQARAESVAARLGIMGIDASRIVATGLGESYPVTGNDSAAGRQQNRRVELVFSDNSGVFPEGQRIANVR